MIAHWRFLILFALLASPLAAQETSPGGERKEPPPPTGPDRLKIDGNAEKFRRIRDNAPFPWKMKSELGDDTDQRLEELAYDEVLIHAARFTGEDLDEAARRDVPFQSLVDSERLSYRLELMRFEGRLRRLQRVEVSKQLKQEGIEAVYEAWVFPVGEGTPICAILTQLPPGLSPQKDLQKDALNRPVAVAGYYFKLLQYEQQGFDRGNPGRHKVWAAPVLIGRSLTLLPDDALVDGGLAWRTTFLPFIIGGFTLLALALVFLSWRYRRGDRAILERALQKRNQNPFENV
jgi:hypothetical protein